MLRISYLVNRISLKNNLLFNIEDGKIRKPRIRKISMAYCYRINSRKKIKKTNTICFKYALRVLSKK